jgi:L-malate glycosyltransferase
VTVVSNGIADEWLGGPRQAPSPAPVVVSISNPFDPLKNTAALLRAFPRIRAQVADVGLRLYGFDFEPGGPAERWARRRGLTGGVEFCGMVSPEEVPVILDRADLMVHPSLEESFGSVVAEAMARGVPVIGGVHSGAVPWVLDHGQAGTLVDVSKPLAIGDAAVSLLCDHARWRALSEAGFARASRDFRVSAVVDAYLDVYEGLVS